ncbi:TPA: hypothetical protein N3I75_003685 [Salmonella enterica subsp. enterica serovar Java]|nr:hypothetical protein [Salmonella enterica subsp. enterica serovar Java]
MSVNIISTVIDWTALFLTSPVFWLGVAGLLFIIFIVVPRKTSHPKQKNN